MKVTCCGTNLMIKWRHTMDDSGRKTLCQLYEIGKDRELFLLKKGAAFCHPQDQYCKSTGRKISLSRTLQNSQLDKYSRRLVWEQYRKECH